ncbi:retrovirus-related pol polyprotein from transposon TNT 1-94 [Tanacetum coccineum]|uniref:Retrovirus-related pol polyprotein from transposon TNT 1-94 n=1 Tax=Tanacetum coccineum TaxID=301880 RepID=A0ABQ5DZ35_9ASTR
MTPTTTVKSDGINEIDMLNVLPNVNSYASYFITFMDDYSRYDRGDEYISQEFKDYLKAYGIFQQLTPPYTPQLSGVSERRNRTLLDLVRLIMNLTTLPLSFWNYALEFVAGILNMVPTKKFDKMPYELWIPKEMMDYYFNFPPGNKIVVARYVEFLEKNIISQEVSGRAVELEEIQDEDTPPSENTSKIPMKAEVEEHTLGDLNEPTNYKAALLDPKSDKWLDAINAEMQSMKDNQVWCLVDLPPNCKTVRSKWLFTKKIDMDGNVHTYKARLVAKVFTQTYRVDYEETFSPVADIRAIRILIAIAAFYDYEI